MNISPALNLPLDFVVETQTILATKGMGKTHLAQVEAEELLEAGQVFVAIDPTDAWWGLRSSADGKSAGYPVTVFGGDHADIALEADAGAAIADFVIEERRPVIICTEGLTQSGEVKVVREFLERMYRKNREPIMLFVDEADMFAPQKPDDPEDAKSIRAMRNIVRRGRKKGLGCTMITQRPAELNKGVLAMCSMLMVLGMEHPLDIEPVEKWARKKKDPEFAREMIESLDTLPQGDAWVMAKRAGLLKRFRAREKRTFDSGATPKPGQRARVAKKLAPIDLQEVGAKIAAMVERQRADDPKALRAQVAELQRKLAAKPAATVETKTIEKAIIKESQLQRIGVLIDQGERIAALLESAGEKSAAVFELAHNRALQHGETLRKVVADLRAAVAPTKATPNIPARTAPTTPRPSSPIRPSSAKPPQIIPANIPGELEPRLMKLLASIAWWNAIGIAAPSVTGVAFVAGYSPTSSGFEKSRGLLRTQGLVDYPSSGTVALTDAGRAIAPRPDEMPTNVELHRAVLGKLEPRHGKLLQPLIDKWPEEVTMDELAELSGYSATSSGFEKARGTLRSLGLATYPRSGTVRAADLLFPEGA